jgi:pyruvate/2-oxoacid:ferredoxin oxidoreductase beta subunit/Pyruvate/2-oxoacid:ferredoxin oxidoreductase gamma subunit
MSEVMHSTYLNENTLPYPFCPGCGHGTIVDQLNQALVKLQLNSKKVVIVTDIGCAGLSDKFFDTNALHGQHGRAVTYATGIKLMNPDLKVIVLIGDGGCGIGGHHLLNAARRNIGVTTIVFNNLNYGMTGGEHSVSTPPGANTSTTRYGQLEQPMDICSTVAVNGASYVARTTSFDKSLPDLIADAISNEGFSLIDIWELCTAYFVPNNKYSRKLLENTLEELEFETGVLKNQPRPEYSRAYQQAAGSDVGKAAPSSEDLSPQFQSGLSASSRCVIAGAAGSKIVSAATIFSKGAILAGLQASQRNDYPVTVKSGFSVSEVILSPEEILFTGIDEPDLMIVLFPEGLVKVKPLLARASGQSKLFINQKLLPVETKAEIIPLDMSKAGNKQNWALAALGEVLRFSKIYPVEALQAATSLNERFAEENLTAIRAGEGLSSQ